MATRTTALMIIWVMGCNQQIPPDSNLPDTPNKPASDSRESITGKVVSIPDGDTFTLLDQAGKEHRVRLQGIDAPERTMAYSRKATEALKSTVDGKAVEVRFKERDHYERILGHVYVAGAYINLELIKNGWAWHYKRYSDDPDMAEAEKVARREKRGLWKDSDPQPPWEFRQQKRESETR